PINNPAKKWVLMVSQNMNQSNNSKTQSCNTNVIESKVFICPSFGMYGKRIKIGFDLGNDKITKEIMNYIVGARSVTIKAAYNIFTKQGDQLFALKEQLEELGF